MQGVCSEPVTMTALTQAVPDGSPQQDALLRVRPELRVFKHWRRHKCQCLGGNTDVETSSNKSFSVKATSLKTTLTVATLATQMDATLTAILAVTLTVVFKGVLAGRLATLQAWKCLARPVASPHWLRDRR